MSERFGDGVTRSMSGGFHLFADRTGTPVASVALEPEPSPVPYDRAGHEAAVAQALADFEAACAPITEAFARWQQAQAAFVQAANAHHDRIPPGRRTGTLLDALLDAGRKQEAATRE